MGSKYKIITISLLSVFTLIGCNNNKSLNFYCDTVREYGVRRIPILEPYELITVDTSTFWNLYCPQTAKYIFSDYSIDSLSYHNNNILIFSGIGNELNFGILNIENGEVKNFKNRDAFMEFRKTDSAWNNLYSVKDLFREYLKTRSLPWSKEIQNYKSCE